MKREEVEKIITAYMKPVFGFALKKCKNLQDAEDLSQEIVMKSFRALLGKDDVADMGKFIWAVAHHALCNYYRDSAKTIIGISMDEIGEQIADSSAFDDDGDFEAIGRLQKEIAYLSKLQRKIVVAYYFENRKQTEIAEKFDLPLGTVKWHLFEAKKELKRGMDKMRKTSELKFNPIQFHSYGINGASGTKSVDEFFRSTLSQNICYCIRNTAKTVNEIADDLGVSPVYVETEVEFLEKYGFLLEEKGRYLANFIIEEPTTELLALQNTMYHRAADLFANDLYDELTTSGILDDPAILCGQTDEPISLVKTPKADRNFILWSLIPYIAACSGEKRMDNRISFEEVATIRPDGAHNIFHADVVSDDTVIPDEYAYMKNWCGPMWNGDGNHILWQIDSPWSDRKANPLSRFSQDAKYILSLYEKEFEDCLSKEEYTWLAERGYVKTNGDYDGYFKSSWQIVALNGKEIQSKLLSIGDRIKEKYKTEFEKLKAPYVEAVMQSVPEHLKKVELFEMQFIFHADGWFLLHCILVLLQNGKLKEPTVEQKKSLTTLIANA